MAVEVRKVHALEGGTARERFRREARILARMVHPGVGRILDYSGEDAPVDYLVLQHVEAPTLQDELNRLGRLPWGEVTRLGAAVATAGVVSLADAIRDGQIDPPRLTRAGARVLRDVAEALDVLHARGLFHRDVKPSNILVVPPGRGVVIDLGLVRVADQNFTASGIILGTMAYLSPEQLLGRQAAIGIDRFRASAPPWLASGAARPPREAADRQPACQAIDASSGFRRAAGTGPALRSGHARRRSLRLLALSR